MQNSNFPTGMPAAPPKKKTGKTLALGCGLPVAALILFIVVAAILDPTPPSNTSKPAVSGAQNNAKLPLYAGKWQGSDGTSIWIRGDGKGDFDGGSTKVTGGGVTIDEGAKTLAITSFFGIGKTWKVDSAPKNGQMTLDGIVYRRSDGFTSSSSDGATTTEMPSAMAQDKMARTTLAEFDRAIKDQDFSRFYKFSAGAWQKQTSPDQLKQMFAAFEGKNMKPLLDGMKPVYSAPALEQTSLGPIMKIKGTYPTKPYQTHFKIGYLKEGEVWRPSSFQLKVGDPIP